MNERQDTPGLYSWATQQARVYDDRTEAGRALGEHLLRYRGEDPLVLGIPRGGVPVAREVAARLDAELDVMVARKIGAPDQKELALGAVTADGTRVVNLPLIEMLNISDEYLESETAAERREASARERRFRPGLPPLKLTGRTVILVDDGLATGATMRACLAALRKHPGKRLVVAVPVGSEEACAMIAGDVDDLVCPSCPEPFYAVGAHYRAFGQVSDHEVERLLCEYREQHAAQLNFVSRG